MSRYLLLDDGRRTVTVGWDPPLESFFFQVMDDPGDPMEDEIVVAWEGWQPKSITDLDALAEMLRPYHELPIETRQALERDRESTTPPTPMQRAMIQIAQEVADAYEEIKRNERGDG